MRRLIQLIMLMLCLALVPALLDAQGKGKGKGKGHADEAAANDDSRAPGGGPVFSERNRGVIRDYFRNPYSNLPPGLAKRGGNLPPGLQKQLDRNGTLPPGLQKRMQPFPPDLVRQLPRLPADYEYGVVGPDAIILNSKTQRIIDIIHAVIGQ